MPDLGKSSEKRTKFSSITIPLLLLLSSFIISHPLYFLKLISFFSPLLVTTFLTLAFTSCGAALEKIRGDRIGGLRQLEPHCTEGADNEDELYKIIFETPLLGNVSKGSKELVNKFLIYGNGGCLQKKDVDEEYDTESHNEMSAKAEKTFEDLFQEKKVMEVKEADTEPKNFHMQRESDLCASSLAWRNLRWLSSSLKILENGTGGLGEEKAGHLLGGFGSMRRTEKEWKRTLACKLFEERHGTGDAIVGGDDEMDLLWETYERNDSMKHGRIKKASKEIKKLREELHKNDEEEMKRQICCLQALKISARKVNLGMGRSNMVRIPEAFKFKGLGLLHHVRARKALLD
ncbi:hypothetical protein SAY86_022099 [Trapa natans]|uniref:Uncharacterized protein n=1 Tax=Trapa natans TaxID=22666 RepID=A0AAN7MB14_TRANT|nr:hypothetical protein SAY86_022099 [Trapa natans]